MTRQSGYLETKYKEMIENFQPIKPDITSVTLLYLIELGK